VTFIPFHVFLLLINVSFSQGEEILSLAFLLGLIRWKYIFSLFICMGMSLSFPQLLKDIFMGYNILGWQFFSLVLLKSHSTLFWFVKYPLKNLFSRKLK
jgi:hypothetical protein